MVLVWQNLPWNLKRKVLEFKDDTFTKYITEQYIYNNLQRLDCEIDIMNKMILFLSMKDMELYLDFLQKNEHKITYLDELSCIVNIHKYSFEIFMDFEYYVIDSLNMINPDFSIKKRFFRNLILYNSYMISNVDKEYISSHDCKNILDLFQNYIEVIETYMVNDGKKILGLRLEYGEHYIILEIYVHTDFLYTSTFPPNEYDTQ